MINLKVSRPFHDRDIWGKKLTYHLTQHPNVQTKIISLPNINVYKGHRNFVPMVYNDIVFIIDDWDHASPTCFLTKYKDDNNILHKFYLNNPTFILKVQYSPVQQKIYDDVYNICGIKVLPFTMFSNKTFDLENFKWDKNHNHKYNCIFTGKPWRCRSGWLNFAKTHKDEIGCESNFDTRAGDHNTKDSNIAFYDFLKETKWGVILKGKGDSGKNRREVEFSSLGMPLALNYIPYYPFPFVPDEDFVLLKQPSDLLKLKDIDPEPFAQRSSKIYQEYWSFDGIYNSFQLVYKLAKEFLNNKSTDIDYQPLLPDKNLVSIPAKTGYEFGKVTNGDVISIQYCGGGWRSWGKGGKKPVNPDQTNGRGGERARLAIYNKNNFQTKFLQLVPENTKNNPYKFNVDGDYNLFFSINDQNHNARGECNYIIKKINN